MSESQSHLIRYGMKEKTIKQTLYRKIESWLKSIDDDEVRRAAKNDTIVTGGSIASMLLGEKINDFDVYFKTKETTKLVANYYIKKFRENNPNTVENVKAVYVSKADIYGKSEQRVLNVVSSTKDVNQIFEDGTYSQLQDLMCNKAKKKKPEEDDSNSVVDDTEEGSNYQPRYISMNAITLTDKIQIVTRFYGSPDEIHRNYDFIHCRNWYTHHDAHLELNVQALQSLMSRDLRYVGSLYPICSLLRMKKFITRGWRCNAGQVLKMAYQIRHIDFNNPYVLQEQLVGCDSLYFRWFISELESARKNGKDVNDDYYVQYLIDKVFDEFDAGLEDE